MNAGHKFELLAAILISFLSQPSLAQVDPGIADVIADNCDAQVLFLGEESGHGGGNSIQTKSTIVRDLVQQCGFDHVIFESQFYDFLDLQDKYAAATATIENLYNAIGGKWSRFGETDELVRFLHNEALARQITISGMAPQAIGAMSEYSKDSLGSRLGSALLGSRRHFCVSRINRLNNWTFDSENPKSSDFDESILDCAIEIERNSQSHLIQDPSLHQMARSYLAFLEFADDASLSGWNRRDRQMYENLAWSIDRLPTDTKTVVWTATIHVLKRTYDKRQPVASLAVEDGLFRTASVAVIAGGGTYRSPDGRQLEASEANTEALERRLLVGSDGERIYADKRVLQAIGPASSRVLGYARYVNLDWGSYLDGVLVIPLEGPPTIVRSPQPMQTRQ